MKRKNKRKKKSRKVLWIAASVTGLAVIGTAVFAAGFYGRENKPEIGRKAEERASQSSPQELIMDYMNHIPRQEYEEMYAMIDRKEPGQISQKDFIKRNSAIYEGIGMQNMEVEISAYDKEQRAVTYQTSFDTSAGNISFENQACFVEDEDGFQMIWDDSLIFPGLSAADKVKVSNMQAKRGKILDRNGRVLAGKGTASAAGIVLGKLESREKAIKKAAALLEIEPEVIEKKLAAKWVREDSFVPIQTLPKVDETELMTLEPDGEILQEQKRQEKLLEIPGVMLSDTEVREYPLGEAAAHLVGYVQSVTAEDLEEHVGEGYTAGSVIGRSGMEGLFEKELKGQNGCRIYNDNNDFIRGLSAEQWKALNEDEDKPMYNRFRQVWCPGSTFKAVTAAIGLETGTVDPTENFGNEGLSWQKDASWGSYHVTTLHAYEPVILENALIYSDNIYFAKAALKIGAEKLEASLTKLGFHAELPFEIRMAESQYSNSGHIETEIQLADSGYGQGQMLINPLHLACIYTAFCNDGNVIRPYLFYREQAHAEYWMPGAFSADAAKRVLEGIKKVVNDPHGTGYGAHREDVVLAGKTGTAEIKLTKEDTTGTELGWFAVFSGRNSRAADTDYQHGGGCKRTGRQRICGGQR